MKKCILIYDDDADILEVCKIILENQNYRVETRMLCNNIIKDIRQVKPDLILMDLWIPEIGGENAINLMYKKKALQNVPTILFSANAEIEEIFKRVHANGFLKKPFEVKAMLEMIESNIPEIA